MEWWKAAISSMYNDAASEISDDPNFSSLLSHVRSSQRNNPVIRSLHRAVVEYNLTKRFLDRLIESRENDLDIAQFDNMDELIQYSEDSVSSSLYLSLECCGIRNEDADRIASHIGIGIGITTAIRSIIPKFALTKDMAIPKDIGEKYSISPAYLQSLAPIDADGDEASKEVKPLALAVREMSQSAMSHLVYARSKQYLVPTEGRPCLLPAVSSLHYLSSLERIHFNLLHPHLLNADSLDGRMNRFKIMLKLLRAKYTGIF
jgi:NADH dehydrogenase [ubiquinone] 1 alpha subcomplex assembly factor 6